MSDQGYTVYATEWVGLRMHIDADSPQEALEAAQSGEYGWKEETMAMVDYEVQDARTGEVMFTADTQIDGASLMATLRLCVQRIESEDMTREMVINHLRAVISKHTPIDGED